MAVIEGRVLARARARHTASSPVPRLDELTKPPDRHVVPVQPKTADACGIGLSCRPASRVRVRSIVRPTRHLQAHATAFPVWSAIGQAGPARLATRRCRARSVRAEWDPFAALNRSAPLSVRAARLYSVARALRGVRGANARAASARAGETA